MRNYFSGSFPRQPRDVGAGGAEGAMPPEILADHVTLFQAGWALLDAEGSSQISFPTQNLERAY